MKKFLVDTVRVGGGATTITASGVFNKFLAIRGHVLVTLAFGIASVLWCRKKCGAPHLTTATKLWQNKGL